MAFNKSVYKLFQKTRVIFYSFISEIKISAHKSQPVLMNGKGIIKIGENVKFGVRNSPYYYSGYTYLDARRKESYIEIGDNTIINNNFTIISDGKKIIIKKNCLIGTNVEIVDSNFHGISPKNRFGGNDVEKDDVTIEENVFIGNNVSILKGVTIGSNSVIGNGTIVTKDIPENVIAAGCPAKIIKYL
jgi:acetyltransferase-like isoleucine patch superfamily enzyme